MKNNLNIFRKQIDAVDKEIVGLLDKRASAIKEIARIKNNIKKEVYDPAREAQVLAKVRQASKGKFPTTGLEAVYNEIFSASRVLQRKTRVIFFGAPASYTHMAAMKRFGRQAEYIPAANTKDVFMEVEKGNADYGCVPIENSTEGAVNYTYDMFADFDLKICSEVMLSIKHHLLSNEKNLAAIKTVYAHPQALAQCREWIENNIPKAKLKEASSNSKGAQLAAQEKGAAAIAGELAAEMYGLKIVATAIQDIADNYTRFFILGNTISKKTGNDKTSIMVSIKDKVGALYKLLKPFEKYKINLTSIESRPSKKKAWDYYFFVDINGYIEDEKVKKAIEEIKKECGYVKVLGAYPKF